MKLLKNTPNIDFFGRRKLFYAISIFLCVGSLILLFTKGFNFGIDFKGGTNIQIKFSEVQDIETLRQGLQQELGVNPSIQVFDSEDGQELIIQLPGQDDEGANEAWLNQTQTKLRQDYPGVDIRQIETIGPKVGGELKQSALMAMLISFAVTLVYIGFRFKYYFGIGTWVALVHDTLITLGMLVLIGFEFDLAMLAAILTVNGYSLNDTIVVYDRIRENLSKSSDSIPTIINRSINETLSRTIVTSLTTLLTMVFLFLFGGEDIKGFAFTIVFGIIVGTYSSIFIASPIIPIFQKNDSDKSESGQESVAGAIAAKS